MLIDFKNGQGSVVIRAKLRDSTVSTGAGKTGLTFASTGLIISTIADNEATATPYTAAGSTIDTIATPGVYAAPPANHCRFKEVDATNHKGLYEFQFADARYGVNGAKSLTVSISGATGLAECDFVIPLRAVDPYDGAAFGMSRLDAGVASRMATYTQPTGFLAATFPGTVASPTNITAGTITTATNLTNLPSIPANWLTAAGIAAGALNGKGDWLLATGVPTNFAAMAIDVSGRVDLGKVLGTASAGAAGYVGLDWGQVTNKTTANALTGTTIAATQKVDVDTIKTNPVVNAGTVTFPTGATLASTTNITAGTITTTTNLTNLPAIPANWLTAAGIAAGALNGKGDWSTYAGGDTPGTTTLLVRIPGTVQPQTGDAYARLGAPASVSVSADIAAVNSSLATDLADVIAIQTSVGTGLGAIASAIKAKTDNLPAGFPANFPALAIDVAGKVTAGTVTTLTNLPAIPAGWLTASGIAGGALNGKGDWLLASGYAAPDNSDVVTALADVVAVQTSVGVGLGAAVAAVKAKTDQLAFSGANVLAVAQNLPSDYQQRGVAATLPANPPAGFLASASYGTAPAWYTAPDNADIAAIRSATDLMAAEQLTGAVLDAAPTASAFAAAAGLSALDGFYAGACAVFTSGALKGLARKVTGYTGSTRVLAFASPFPAAPASGDTFVLLGRIDG
jgi:hypothetical protein